MAYQAEKLPQYDALRRRLQGQFQQKRQESGDAIQRRYAAQGMLNSGAYNKSVEENERQFTKDEADATAQLDFAEMNEQQRRKEVAEGRDFAREGMQFQKSEREASQLFNKELFDRDMEFKRTVFGDESKARWAQIDLALEEFKESKKANEINAVIGLAGAEMEGGDFAHYLNQFRELTKQAATPAGASTVIQAAPAQQQLPLMNRASVPQGGTATPDGFIRNSRGQTVGRLK